MIPCLSAAGSVPATGFLKQSGINMDSKGFITVNKVCLKPCGLCGPAASPHSFHLLDSQTMQTNADGVFAGGDAVTFPFPPRNNKKVNIPHWQMAHVHGGCVAAAPGRPAKPRTFAQAAPYFSSSGRMAALSMMDRAADIKTVPFFWSAMFGKTLRYAGRVEMVR